MFDGFSVWAKAIEDGEGRDATAALVVTCTGSPNGNDIEHYVSAGHGIAPLVRELRLLTSIQDAASTDALTRLRNRKTVLRQLDALLLDGSGDVAIMMIDADYFARINNELGHLAGDRCLQSIAGAIKDAVRDDDVTGRYGGEEFIVVMPAASPAGAAAVAERIRAAVRNCGARYASGEAVTVSIGLAWAAAGETRQALIDRADRALYRAKSAGRDCVVEAAPHELPRA